MEPEIAFLVLGPLVVRVGASTLPIRPGKQRALLAALLMSANQMVSHDELAEALWGPHPPPSARATLHNYVKLLRKALAATAEPRIRTVPDGYLILADDAELDVLRFEALRDRARDAARQGAWARAAQDLRAALDLWRGEPLADVHSDLLILREVPRLAEMRLQAVEARLDAELHLGRHSEVVAELRRLTAVHPLRERLHALLILALYRDSQQGEALAAFRRARRVLVQELGADPGPELRRLQQQILAADPALAAPVPAHASAPPPFPPSAGRLVQERIPRESRSATGGGPATVAAGPVPRQLPSAVSCFTGRAGELAALTGLLEDGRGSGAAVVISVIAGTAGVGKTGLAMHWAHQVAPLFPDGQLYVNLRGYDPGPLVAPADALAGFLRGLGMPGAAIPAELEELAARYRSLLANRRMLVLLDNARDARQVRPLLPGTAGCLALVTSRDSLAGLVARDGARRIELDALPLSDAVSLLRELVGERVDTDPDAARVLAQLCCRLPLALRVAAELAVARPRMPLSDMAAELADQQRQLDLLDAGQDQATAVRAVLSWSDRQLDPADARAFWLLGLHPGPGVDAHGMAALTATTVQDATRRLSQLARAHLIQPASPGRYGMHDLLRRYAADRATALGDQDEAGERLLRFLQDTALRAEALCQRDIRSTAIARHRPADPAAPRFVGRDEAQAWLRAERPVLLACLDQVTAQGKHARVVALTAGLTHLLRTDGPLVQARARHAAAARAARELGDRLAQAHALLCLGDACGPTGDRDAAQRALIRASEIFRGLGEELGLASALERLSFELQLTGDHPRAATALSEAHDIFRGLGDGPGVASTLMRIGEVHRMNGNYADAAATVAAAVAMFGQLGDRTGRAHALLRLGLARCVTDSYPAGAANFAEALGIYREIGLPMGQANALLLLGEAQSMSGDHEPALRNLAAARDIFRGMSNRRDEANALLRLGETLTATGDHDTAATHLTGALTAFRDEREPIAQASTMIALANLCRITGDYPASEQALADAHTISRDHDAAGLEAEILNQTGLLHHSRGNPASARACHQDALHRARQLAIPLEEGRALAGLGRCALAARDHASALALFQQAHALLTLTGAAEAHALATELNACAQHISNGG